MRPATLVDNDKLRDAAKLIELGKIDREKVKLYEQQVQFLNERIALKDSIIRTYVLKDTTNARIVDTYKQEITNLQQQRNTLEKALAEQNKYYRRQKRKTVFTAIAGSGVTAAIILYLKH